MALRRNDIRIDTGDLDKLIKSFRDYPPLLLKSLPPALRKEVGPTIRGLRRKVKSQNWPKFIKITTRQLPKKFKEVGIRVKPNNNLSHVFEYGFAHRKVKQHNVPRSVFGPEWRNLKSSSGSNIQNNLIREAKAQLVLQLRRKGL